MLTLKAQIIAAIAAGTASTHDNGKAVLFNGILYIVKSNGYQRMKAQKENRKRLGIVLAPPAPPVVAPPVTGVKVIAGPAAVRFGGPGRRSMLADFLRMAARNAPPAKVKVIG